MPRFFGLVKGWIARTLPELMPKGALQRCHDLNFSIEGGLRCCREFQELTTPSGVSSTTQKIKSFFQHTSGGTISTFILKGNDLFLDLNNAGFNSLVSISATTYSYLTSFTENDTTGNSVSVYADGTGCTLIKVPTSHNYLQESLYTVESNVGDFTYKFDFKCTGVSPSGLYYTSTGQSWCRQILWGVSDGYPIGQMADVDQLSLLWMTRNTGSSIGLVQANGDTKHAQSWFSGVTIGARRYYATITKNSSVGSYGRVTCSIYNEKARTNLLGTVSVDLTKSFSTSHLYTFSAWRATGSDDRWSGEIRNLVKTSGQVSADEDYAIYKVMTPSVSTKPIVYIATSNRLLRSGGETRYVSGSSWVQVGVPTPSGMSTCKVASGVLTGTYQAAYTYYDSETGAESEPSGISTLILSSEKIKVRFKTDSTSTGHANTVKLYRSIAGGGTLFLNRSVTINRSAATQTNILNTSDSSLGTSLPDVGKPPPQGSLIEAWKGRLWVSGVSQFQSENAYNRVYYSRNLNPETVPPDYYLAIANTEAIVKGFAIFEGRLYVITETDIYEIEGSTSDSFKFSDSLAPVGTVSTDSIAVGRKGIYFVYKDGVYRFRYTGEKISTSIEWAFKHSGVSWTTTLASSAINQAKGWFYDGLYYVTIGSDTLIYDEEGERWRKRDREFTCGWFDRLTSRMYAGVSTPSHYMLGHLINDETTGVSGLVSPEFVTHPVYIQDPSEDNPIPRVNRVGKYKVNARGYWTFYFYCDDVLAHTTTGTTFTGASRNQVLNLPADIKGTTLYVRGVAGSNPTPAKTKFYAMEVW